MGIRIFSIIYVTLFLVLSVALFVVIIPSKNEYKDYKKSRHILGSGFVLLAMAITIRQLFFPHTNEIGFTGFFAVSIISYLFNCLNFISFLYMIETSRPKRKVLKKISIAIASILLAGGLTGTIFPETQAAAKILMCSTYSIGCLILFIGSIREYDKFILQMDNFYEDELNIRWIPGLLWATFILSILMNGTFFHKYVSVVTGMGSVVIYTFLAMKLLSFLPENIHVVRRSIQTNKIIAEDHGEHIHLFPIDGPKKAEIPAETETIELAVSTKQESGTSVADNTAVIDKDAKRNEKVAALIEKWVNMEKYTATDINIKDVAVEMGTNSNYLSVYLNKVLDTSFATWLNTLRIDKSKEYLCGNQRLSIEECGIKVGYTCLYNYSRWFKTITGMSPSEWRKHQCNTKLS